VPRFRSFLAIVLLVACQRRSEPRPEPVVPPSAAASTAPSAAPSAAPDPAARAARLVVVAGGDVNLARGVGRKLVRGEPVDPFQSVRPILESGDVVLCNLESQLSDQRGETQSRANPLVFSGPPAGADLLARAGIDVVSVANNHMWDYGEPALLETLANLRRAHVAYAGAAEQASAVYEPAILRARGWSVAVFAVTHIWNQGSYHEHAGRFHVAWATFDLLRERLARARREQDVVIVSYHGGDEYGDGLMQWTRDFVRAVMEAGADAVIGHHPHVPQGVGWFADRPAFYSLGNLVFDVHRDYEWTGMGFLARLSFEATAARPRLRVEACPYQILGVTPTLLQGKLERSGATFKRHLAQVSLTTGGTRLGEPGEYGCIPLDPPEPRSGSARP
jgi:hypothetical protein